MTQPAITSDTSEIPLSVPQLFGNESAYIQQCLETNFVSSVGPFVGRFENEFAQFVGAPHAIACASGTAALHLALKVAGVGSGDEVLVSDFTFVATVNPITYLGAEPVLVDADPATWNMSAALVSEELDARARRGAAMPKAVLVAHILGLPADIAPIAAACERHGVTLIEDAAEALGASYSSGPFAGKQVGTVGLIGCYSFNGNKIITTGGGGMVTTADEKLAVRTKHLSTQAKLPGAEYMHDEIGFNYRLTNLAAALGVAQLEQLHRFIEIKRRIARRYDDALAYAPGVSLPPRPEWADPTMWLYSIMLDAERAAIDSRTLHRELAKRHIQTRPVWAPSHLMPFYRSARRIGGSFGETLFRDGISLPCSVGLTDAQQTAVIDALRELGVGAAVAANS